MRILFYMPLSVNVWYGKAIQGFIGYSLYCEIKCQEDQLDLLAFVKI